MLFRIAAFSAFGIGVQRMAKFLECTREEAKLATNQDDAPHRVVSRNGAAPAGALAVR
jgi:hypothetical protein